jgi:hypothetical protein
MFGRSRDKDGYVDGGEVEEEVSRPFAKAKAESVRCLLNITAWVQCILAPLGNYLFFFL